MTNDTDKQIAEKIHDAGWRMGSLLSSLDCMKIPFEFDPLNELFVIITQSCSVVSVQFDNDPNIEVMAAKKLPNFNSKSGEATGKDQRELHLEISSKGSNFSAIACDINRRFSFSRELLLKLTLNDQQLLQSEIKKMTVWIARYYTRIALPDELGKKMRLTFLPSIEKILKKKIGAYEIHSEINDIYIQINNESEQEKITSLNLIFMCANQSISSKLDMELNESLMEFCEDSGKDGILINQMDCKSKDQIFVSELDGYERFSDWDRFSILGEISIGKY